MDTGATEQEIASLETKEQEIARLETKFKQLYASTRGGTESDARHAFTSTRRDLASSLLNVDRLRQNVDELMSKIDREDVGAGGGPFLTRLEQAHEALRALSDDVLAAPGGPATDDEGVQKGSLRFVGGVLGSCIGCDTSQNDPRTRPQLRLFARAPHTVSTT